MALLAGLDRGIEPILLLVELGAQEVGHDQPQPVDAPFALHGDGDLVEALDHRLDAIGRRRHRLGGGVELACGRVMASPALRSTDRRSGVVDPSSALPSRARSASQPRIESASRQCAARAPNARPALERCPHAGYGGLSLCGPGTSVVSAMFSMT